MRIKRVFIATLAILLIACSLPSCSSKPNTNPAALLKDLKGRAERLTIYASGALSAIDQLRASPSIQRNEKIMQALDVARPAVVTFQESAVPFASLVEALATLDAANKEQLRAAFALVTDALAKLKAPLSELVAVIVGMVDKNADAERWRTDIALALTGIEVAVGIIASKIQ